MDNKLPKGSQNLRLIAVAALLIITPLVSTSLRFKYLYFIVNILIIAVGADAGLLSFLLQSAENKRPAIAADDKNGAAAQSDDKAVETTTHSLEKNSAADDHEVVMVKTSPSSPGIFFIVEDKENAPVVAGEAGFVEDDGKGEELFQKAETFIGNFYKQLKMQGEESAMKLH